MKNSTKTTGIMALIGAAVAGTAVVLGKLAANKDNAEKKTDEVFDELDNYDYPDTEETIEEENTSEAETEPEEV